MYIQYCVYAIHKSSPIFPFLIYSLCTSSVSIYISICDKIIVLIFFNKIQVTRIFRYMSVYILTTYITM